MNREKLIDEAALNLFRQEYTIPGPEREKAWLNLGIHYVAKIEAALAAIEAAGVRLVYPGAAQAQLIDGDERTTVTIFTPYAPPGG